MTPTLFSPIELRGLRLENRIAVAPMCQYNAEHGVPGDWHLMHLGSLSMSGAGLLVAEATGVSAVGRITHKCLGLWNDAQEQALARVLAFCRARGTAKLGIQLAHAGRKASTQVPLQGGKPLGAEEAPWPTVAPSALPFAEGWHVPQALDGPGLMQVKSELVESAMRAARVGIDLVQLHMAHGYLLHQFLSPLSNVREDAYGGCREGRMRFPLECFKAVREIWPAERPLGVRVSAVDWVEGGLEIDDTLALAHELKALGCDFIDVSSGGVDPRQKIELKPGYQVHLAERIRRETGMVTWAVGLITGARQANAIIAEGQADMVALARGVMDDPRWGWHAARTLGVTIDYPPDYVRARPDLWPGAGAMRME